MANIPLPRSRNQIVGGMINTILSRTGYPSLQVGNPVLSFVEAAGQSDLRGSQDTFNALNANSLDRAEKQALDRAGADEDCLRLAQSPSTGNLTITDTSFTKISTSIYQGAAAPIVGAPVLLVESAQDFPAIGGNLYIGRGTKNYEGPIPYTATANMGSYWTISLGAGGTTKFHNLGESVVFARGGNRTIDVGTTVRTSQGNAGSSVQFATSFAAVIPDGETTVLNVPATARIPGTVGNVVMNSVVEFVSAPFTGAAVTNPIPFANGRDTEDDDTYRERIRQARQSRSKGTAIAIKSGIIGLTAPDENNRILSASVVVRQGEPTTVYIDDGTGYEEKTVGIAYEAIVDSAIGGEQYFQLANGRPVAKAFLKSTLQAPFALTAGAELAVEVGGRRSTHIFQAADFAAVANATSYEVVASINADPTLGWTARTADGRTDVSVFAKADANETIQVVAPGVGAFDANVAFGFPTQRAESLWLYQDDRLLSKDGALASLTTKTHSSWSSISTGDTLLIEVDGIPLTITVNDIDFVNAGTSYITVSQANSLSAWAKVLNRLIPGVTTSVSGGSLTLTSNRDRSSEASLRVTGGVIGAAVFAETESFGMNSDYTLDRNLGQLKLDTPLPAGSRLTAGSFATRSFLETPSFSALTVAAEGTSVTGQLGAEIWLVVDGNAAVVPVSVGPGSSLQVSGAVESWGQRVRYTSPTALNLFENAQRGDWLIATDAAFSVDNRGAFRIVDIATSSPFSWVEVEQSLTWSATELVSLTNGGLKVVRSSAVPQRIYIGTAGNPWTASTLAAAISSQIEGGEAATYRTTRVRVRTNTFTADGSIACVAGNQAGVALGFAMLDAEASGVSHLANLRTTNSQNGTPSFVTYSVSSTTGPTVVDYGSGIAPSSGSIFEGLKSIPDLPGTSGPRWGNDDYFSSLEYRAGTVLHLRQPVIKQWLPEQRFYAASPFAITPNDQLGLVVDGDVVSKRYVMNMFRRCTPADLSYGITATLRDADNGGHSLAEGFGVGFDWSDFAVYMHSRATTELSPGATSIMWRYYRQGPEGNYARVGYSYPATPSSPVGVSVDSRSSDYVNVSVSLASSAARTLPNFRATTYVGRAITSIDVPNGLSTYTEFFNVSVSAGARLTGTTTLTLTTPGLGHGLLDGDQIYVNLSDPSFPSGPKTITAHGTNTVSYSDPGVDSVMVGTGTVSRDVGGIASLSGASALVGDIRTFSGTTAKTLTLADDKITYSLPGVGVVGSVLVWVPVVATSNYKLYPLDASANTTSAIVTSVNALAGTPITGVEKTAGTISWATYEAPANGLGAIAPWFSFQDGVNFVRSTNTPALPTDDFVFTFKDNVATGLVDWPNEDVRLVPTTAKNVVDYLNTAAVSGLFSSAEIVPALQNKNPQLTTITPGGLGSIQASGGSANALSAAVIGSAVVSGTGCTFAVSSSEVVGLGGDTWVALNNAIAGPKSIISSATGLTTLDATGRVVITGTQAWTSRTNIDGDTWQVEKQGHFTAYVWNGALPPGGFASIQEGDWAVVDPSLVDPAYPTTGTMNSLNRGAFRVVRTEPSTYTFWIENANTVEEVASADIHFFTFDSVMPNDSLTINTTLWGVDNLGTWKVTSLDLTNAFAFRLNTTSRTPIAIGPVGALGSSAGLVQIHEATPGRLIKKVLSIAPNGAWSDVKVSTPGGLAGISAAVGTVLSSLDKLALGAELVPGVDGYTHYTGLIAEANRVIYADESQSSSYPGIAAAGADLNINGSLIRRIQVSLGVRTKTGVSTQDIKDTVRSNVASVINQTPVGVPVSIGALVAAAQKVNGVVGVSVLSPAYGPGNDLIAIQPYEKPFVVNLEQDILVTLVGD